MSRMKSLLPLVLASVICLAGVAQAQLVFVPVTPCRVADTRNATGPFGGPSIAGGTTRSFVIPSSACSIPATADAYSVNVTVVPRAGLGYLTVWPTGVAQPLVSLLNSDGRVKANAAIVPAGTGGAISVYATDTTDFVLDINGYFVPSTSASALEFYPLTPCRVADTRNPSGSLGGPSLVGMQTRAFPILSSACNIPSSALAYSLNFTAVPQAGLGYLSAWPTGQAWPGVSTLNVSTNNPVVANAAIVPAGTPNGEINVLGSNNTDVVIDINGYFAPANSAAGGQSLIPVTPCRPLDTRSSSGSFNGTLPVNITSGPCGIPSSAEAFVLNATVVPTGGLGYLTLWPENEAQPVVSTLNADDGVIASNMAIVPTTNGSIDAFSSSPTQLILDINGYFATNTGIQGLYTTTALIDGIDVPFDIVVLPNGTFYAMYGETLQGVLLIGGLIVGQGTAANGTFTVANATNYLYQSGGGESVVATSDSGTYVAGTSISGTDSQTGLQYTATALPSSQYNPTATPSIATLVGTWTLSTVLSITVNSDGTFTGSETLTNCQFSGAFTPDTSGLNVFDMTLTLTANTGCTVKTYAGIALVYLQSDGVTHQMIGGAVDISNSQKSLQFGVTK